MNSCAGNCGQGDRACKTPELCTTTDSGPLLGLYLLLVSGAAAITLLIALVRHFA